MSEDTIYSRYTHRKLAYVLHLLHQAALERIDRVEDFEGRRRRKRSFKRRVFGKNQCRNTVVRRKCNQKVVDLHNISRLVVENITRLVSMTYFFGKLVFHTQ